MYLSRIKLNTSLRKTMQAMAAPNLFHGAIENSESDARTRKLWRLDTLNGEKYLLILSRNKLDFSSVAEQFGYGTEYECKNYDGLLERITNGSKWHFRLKANPTIQKSSHKDDRGKILAHITTTHQEEWLIKRSEKNGFKLKDEEWLVTESRWYIFKKNKEQKNIATLKNTFPCTRRGDPKVKLLSVTYEGILTVTDADAFRNALVNGIGREKAYGLGLMTIVGVKE